MHEYRLTIPTILTLGRIVLIPCIVVALLNNYWTVACVLFAVCAVTDILDGFIARRYNQQTILGAMLDPLADKLLMIAIFVTFSYNIVTYFCVPRWFILLLIAKEMILVLGATALFCTKYHVMMRPSLLGKLAMCFQVLFVGWLFASCFLKYECPVLNQGLLYAIASVVVGACIDYILKVCKILQKYVPKEKE